VKVIDSGVAAGSPFSPGSFDVSAPDLSSFFVMPGMSGMSRIAASLSDEGGVRCALDGARTTTVFSCLQPTSSTTALKTAHLVIILGIVIIMVIIVRIPRSV
jgi:hypothetical protein